MSSSSDTFLIGLGSTSVLKTEAVNAAFEQGSAVVAKQLGVDRFEYKVVGVNSKSEVNEQPIGWAEIIKGANNRVKNAIGLLKEKGSPRLVITIENGAVNVPENGPDYWMDLAWVVLLDTKTDRKFSASSTSVHVPAEIMEKTIKKGPSKFTLGDVLHATDPSISKKEPHSSLLASVLTRVPLMQQAVLSCIGQWVYDLSKQT